MSTSAFQIATPFVSYEEYSRLTGTPVATVRNLVRSGRLPIRKKTKPQEKPYINMLALMKEASDQALSA
jgi:hypothetical protein